MPTYTFPASVGPRPPIDVVDSTWIAAAPSLVAAEVADAVRWTRWWPGLTLRVQLARGDQGMQWHAAGAGLTGSAEVWLQPDLDGVIAHFFLRLEPADGAVLSSRAADRVRDRYRRLTKRAFWALGDELDPGRFARHTSVPHAVAG